MIFKGKTVQNVLKALPPDTNVSIRNLKDGVLLSKGTAKSLISAKTKEKVVSVDADLEYQTVQIWI